MSSDPKEKPQYGIIKKDDVAITLARSQAMVSATRKILNKSRAARVIKFLLSHEDFFIFLISRLYPLNGQMIEKYGGVLETYGLIINESITLSDKFGKKFNKSTGMDWLDDRRNSFSNLLYRLALSAHNFAAQRVHQFPNFFMGLEFEERSKILKAVGEERWRTTDGISEWWNMEGCKLWNTEWCEWWMREHFDWMVVGSPHYKWSQPQASWWKDLKKLFWWYKISGTGPAELGEEIWQKIFRPVLNDEIVDSILENISETAMQEVKIKI